MPTGLQTCAKVLQMHLSRGGGTPWLQPQSNVTFKLASPQYFKFLVADFRLKYFHYSGHCAHRVANLCKSAANAPFKGVGGHLGCNPKVYKTFKLASPQFFKFLVADFRLKYFHYSGHCAHRVANLWKSAANAPFKGWGDTLQPQSCNPKVM